MSTELRLDEPGTLVRPGPVGRFVRLGFGALCLGFLWKVLQTGTDILTSTLSSLIDLSIGTVLRCYCLAML